MLASLDSFGHYAKREGFGLRDGQFTSGTILQGPRKLQYFRYPAAIIFSLGFDSKLHVEGLHNVHDSPERH